MKLKHGLSHQAKSFDDLLVPSRCTLSSISHQNLDNPGHRSAHRIADTIKDSLVVVMQSQATSGQVA